MGLKKLPAAVLGSEDKGPKQGELSTGLLFMEAMEFNRRSPKTVLTFTWK